METGQKKPKNKKPNEKQESNNLSTPSLPPPTSVCHRRQLVTTGLSPAPFLGPRHHDASHRLKPRLQRSLVAVFILLHAVRRSSRQFGFLCLVFFFSWRSFWEKERLTTRRGGGGNRASAEERDTCGDVMAVVWGGSQECRHGTYPSLPPFLSHPTGELLNVSSPARDPHTRGTFIVLCCLIFFFAKKSFVFFFAVPRTADAGFQDVGARTGYTSDTRGVDAVEFSTPSASIAPVRLYRSEVVGRDASPPPMLLCTYTHARCLQEELKKKKKKVDPLKKTQKPRSLSKG